MKKLKQVKSSNKVSEIEGRTKDGRGRAGIGAHTWRDSDDGTEGPEEAEETQGGGNQRPG